MNKNLRSILLYGGSSAGWAALACLWPAVRGFAAPVAGLHFLFFLICFAAALSDEEIQR